MAPRTQSVSRFGRRILWLAAAVLLVVLAYTGLWFYGAHMLEKRAARSIAELNGGGVRAHCEEPVARGFPFRIGLFCNSVFYENVGSGVSVRAGALRSTANVYQPFRVLGEVDGPATVELPFLVPIRARWESLRGSTRLADPLPERLSLEGRNIEISPEEGGTAPLAVLPAAEAHVRRLGDDLEAAVTFQGLMLGEEIAAGIPPLEGRLLASIQDGVTLIESRLLDLRGRSAVIQELVVGVAGEDTGLSLSGPIAVDADGLLDAELSIRMENPAKMGQILAQIFPEASSEIMTAAAALGSVPLQLRIVGGRAFAGFIPLGRIPPI